MKKYLLLLLLPILVFAQVTGVKISQLPTYSGSTVGVNDVFPIVVPSLGANGTRQMKLFDILNLPPFATYNAPTATALAALPTQCVGGNFATGITADGDANCGTPVGSGTVQSVSLSTPSWLTVTGSPVTTVGTFSVVSTSTSANQFLASPNNTAGPLVTRAIVAADVPVLNQNTTGNAATATQFQSSPSACPGSQFVTGISANGTPTCSTPSGSGNGTVTSVALSTPSWLTVSGSPITTAGAFSVVSASTSANQFLASPSGGSGVLTTRAIVAADVPTLNQNTTGNAATATQFQSSPSACPGGQYVTGISANGTPTCGTPSGAGTVTSVGLSTPGWLTVTSSPVTTTGTFSVVSTSTSANQFLASPSSGSGVLTTRAITAADVPTLAYAPSALASGDLFIGSAGNVATATAMSGNATISNTGVLTVGANQITNAMRSQMAGSTIKGNNSATTGNEADLTSAQATALLAAFVGDSGSGGTQGVVPAPPVGSAAAGKFLKADGTFAVPPGSGGGGTVTSVGISTPSWLTVTNSPVTTNGTFSVVATSTSANQFLASPSGGAGVLATRAIVAADIPQIPTSKLNNGTNASNSTFWRGDGLWVSPPSTSVYAFNTQTGSTYQLILSDGRGFPSTQPPLLYMNSASTQVVTVPTVSTVNFQVGDRVDVIQQGAGEVDLHPAAGVTLHSVSGTVMNAQYSMATLIQTAQNIWTVTGANLSSLIVATGGTITFSGNYKIHTFTTSGTFQITAGSGIVFYNGIAGGGGGGSDNFNGGGGGGAGGFLQSSSTYAIGSFPVTIGNGGTGGTANGRVSGGNGNNSIFDTHIATGGGGGGNWGTPNSAGNGGSGGGSGGNAGATPGTGIAGQGFGGGTSASVTFNASGGGGGAGGVGAAGNGVSPAGNGGIGLADSITGVLYASGGGGGGNNAGLSPGTASTGGGGNGGSSSGNGVSGTANTGGGGGGGGGSGGGSGGSGGNGASGLFEIYYLYQ